MNLLLSRVPTLNDRTNMKNSHLSSENRKLYNWCKNSYIFDRNSGKEIIIKDCLAVSSFYFKDGVGHISTPIHDYPVQYYSKLSKDGFEYAKTRNDKDYIVLG